ncbi:MAG: tRNA (adenosine(37)-N6)-threonylcarbamoyltransferase complex dimerization subunit type 1 TsaB [Janthinobacterium lividum]
MPELVLAIDTTTDVTVGVARGREVLAGERVTDRMAHVEQLMPLVHRTLAASGASVRDVGQVVVGLGPGPFTGLRVGIVTAQVLAHVAHVDLHGVCSLDVVALAYARSSAGVVEGRPPSGRVPGALASGIQAGGVGGRPPSGHSEFLVATDARRKEVYWARYAADGRRVGGPEVSSPDLVPRLPTVGPAADLYADRLDAVPGPRTLDAGLLAAYGLDLPSAGTEPLYLRRPDAAEPTRRKSVLRLPPGQEIRR